MRSTAIHLAVAGLAIAAAACSSPSAEHSAAAPPIPVTTAAAESTSFASTFEAGGVVQPRATAMISSRIVAPVIGVSARAGDRVRRGQTLVTLDGREIEANRARSVATLASLVESERAAQADVRAAQAALTLARATFERIRALHEKKSATPQELDQATAAMGVAEGRLAQAQAQVAASAAAREAAASAQDAAVVASTYTMLVAPFDGLVTTRSIDPGSMASPGAGLITLEDTASFRLEVSVDDSRVASVKAGDSVPVQIGDEPAPELTGTVAEIARVDPSSHSAVVKIDLPGHPALRSGQYGRARFRGSSRTALTIPATATIHRGQLTFVFTVDKDSRARLRAVSPGSTTGDRIEILAGLSERDAVIVNPPPALTDGSPVAGAAR